MSVLCEQAPRLLPSFTAAECHFTASVLARTTLCSSAEQAAQQQAAAEARPKRAAPVAARADPVALQWPELVAGGDADAEVLALLAAHLDGVVERAAGGARAGSSQPDDGGWRERRAPRATPFHGRHPPPIRVSAYVLRIAKHAKCSPVCFAMAYVYLERAARADPAHALTALNVHRLLITAVLLAAKLTDDNFYNNAFYAKIGGVATRELNRLELELLKLLDFRLLVPAEELRGVLRRLRGAGAARTPAPAPAPARCLPSQPARPAAAGGAGPPRRSKKRGSEGERSASAPPPPAQARRGCQAAPAAEAAEAA